MLQWSDNVEQIHLYRNLRVQDKVSLSLRLACFSLDQYILARLASTPISTLNPRNLKVSIILLRWT